jgi:hypothetical protein
LLSDLVKRLVDRHKNSSKKEAGRVKKGLDWRLMSVIYCIIGMGGSINEEVVACVNEIEMSALVYTLGKIKDSTFFLRKFMGLLVVAEYESI